MARVLAIEHTARGLNDLTVPPALQFCGLGSAPRVIRELIYVIENPLNESSCRFGVFQSNVIRDRIKVA